MATQITAKCTFTKHGVKVCYPPQVIGGSGISGNGDVDYVTSIKTVVGGAGSAIVTIGKSDIYDPAGAATWTKSLAGGASLNFTALDLTSFDYANIYANSGVTGIGLIWSNTDAGVTQRITNDPTGLSFSVADKATTVIQTALVLGYSKAQFYSPDSPLGMAGTLMIDSSGYIYTGSGGGGGTTTNPLTIGTGLTGGSFDGSAAVTIAIDSSVVTLTGAQALSNKTGNISQWTNDSGYVTLSSALAGLSITGSSITSGSSIISAFGALQNQINGILGGAIYQGVWNANTNSPALASGVGTKGYYYVVSVDGSTNLDGITDWKVGDWAIFNGLTWDKVDNTDAVSSVNGAIGAVVITVTGTTNRISVSGGTGLTPTIDISASYAGQNTITTVGTITTGAWNGTLISPTYGGTGVNNGSFTITLAGNLVTTGAFNTTFAASATGTYTLPSATSTLLANNLGISGGSTLIGGTAATAGHGITFIGTSFASTSSTTNSFVFKAISTEEILRMGNFGNSELRMWAYGQSGANDFFVRAGTNYSYINAGTDLRLQVGGTSYINMLSGSGTVAIQKPMTFASGANVTLVAGSTTLAPLIFNSGTYKNIPAAGSMEYNGQFSLTPTDATRRYIVLAVSATKVTAGAPYTNDGYITLNINGTDRNFMTTA